MTDGIGRIMGGNNYIGGYVPQRKDDEASQNEPAQPPVNNHEETQVDPAKVMAFLESNNIFVNPKTTVTAPAELDQATQARVASSMEQFEMIYALIQDEFGEENAPMIMDFVMDSLMGMVA